MATYKRKTKEFVCGVCKKDFNKKNSYKKHMMDAHNMEILEDNRPKEQTEFDKGWR